MSYERVVVALPRDFTRFRDLPDDAIWWVHAAHAEALRSTHGTLLLDKGVPVHAVAARCCYDSAGLLR